MNELSEDTFIELPNILYYNIFKKNVYIGTIYYAIK